MNPAATNEFRENRARFTIAQLQPYEGQWVAFSEDGKRIVDSGEDLVALYNRIRESSEIVAFECIQIDSGDTYLGGGVFVILRFPYLPETIAGPPPPSLPNSAQERWRPLVPIVIHGPLGAFPYTRALVDPGADDTIFPIRIAATLGIPLLPPTGHAMRWRGQQVVLRFGTMELELVDAVGGSLRWPATVGFTVANARYPLLGMCGFLEYLDVKFFGKDRALEVEANSSFPVTP